ncbi:hypothetical protein V8C86DRAFT_1839150 [Haematococcus lacustris]
MADLRIVGVDETVPTTQAASSQQGPATLVSSTGAVVTDRESLQEHYKSDFHRYNLKRKVAGLPPVTREWFEARKAQLASAQASTATATVPPGCVRVWFDPLTRKTFRNEQTWQSHVRSNKYLELVRKSGEAAPEPVISIRRVVDAEATQGSAASGISNKAAPTAAQQQQQQGSGYTLVPVSKSAGNAKVPAAVSSRDEDEEGDDSGWETASNEDDAVAPLPQQSTAAAVPGQQGAGDASEQEWEDWDLRCSLFDNHVSKSFDANLEYMWRTFGFYLPDSQFLKDPEGLVKYLGAKLKYGHIPLYSRGDDEKSRSFRSLHAVQRHMVDSGRCKMVYEDNEEEYADFYDYEAELGSEAEDEANNSVRNKSLALTGDDAPAVMVSSGYELLIPGAAGGAGGKVIGSREFARYYKQRHKHGDDRQIVTVNTMLAKYRALGISLRDEAVSLEHKKAKSKTALDLKWAGKRATTLFMRGNVNRNLPSCVPY